MRNRLVILGGGESGVGAAYLAFRNGIDVFLSEKKKPLALSGRIVVVVVRRWIGLFHPLYRRYSPLVLKGWPITHPTASCFFFFVPSSSMEWKRSQQSPNDSNPVVDFLKQKGAKRYDEIDFWRYCQQY